jgi:hypothetical protein
MKLKWWQAEPTLDGVQVRMRRLLGVDAAPARRCPPPVALDNTIPGVDKVLRSRTPPETSALERNQTALEVPSPIVTYESPSDLSGLAYPGVLPPTVERWVCDESGTA